jgi:hypothetical protein
MNNTLVHRYDNYRIYFSFKVRNGDTIVYLFDSESGNELFNGQVTESGFRIDTGGSNYLDISVKKEVLNDARDGLVEDVRFNRTAKNGSEYKDPGIYTVTVRNTTSNDEPTTKVIYVGDDDLLKASVANSMSIPEVQRQLDAGATVNEDGTLMQASADGAGTDSQAAPSNDAEGRSSASDSEGRADSFPVTPLLIALGIGAAVIVLRRLAGGRQGKAKQRVEETKSGETQEGSE